MMKIFSSLVEHHYGQ